MCKLHMRNNWKNWNKKAHIFSQLFSLNRTNAWLLRPFVKMISILFVFLGCTKIEFRLSFVIHSSLYFDNSTPVLFRQTFCRTKTHLMSIFWHEFLWIFAGKKKSLGRDQINGTCREHVCNPILCGDTFYYCWLSRKILSNTYPRMRRCM